MHLLGPHMTTTQYNTKKNKKNKSAKLIKAEKEHEAYLKKLGVGKTKLPTNAQGFRVGLNDIPDYRENKETIPLTNKVAENGAVKEQPKYTGDEIAGIATMHKSNAVPVRKDNKTAAIEISQMRR